MSLRVYGIVMHDPQVSPTLPAGIQLQPVRELAALCEEGEFTKETDPSEIQRHLQIVEELFGQDAVLPTPVGTVFKSVEVLQRWMELHYVALSDALAWIEDRVSARIHVVRVPGNAREKESQADLVAIAAEVTRALRRRAVATVPLRNGQTQVASAAYLVEAALWNEFADAVGDEREHHPLLRIDLSGPWPPYDFVRFQFGS